MKNKILCMLLGGFALGWGQVIQVSGTVENASGQPIEGAAVSLQTSGISTTTNAQGAFSLEDEGASIHPHYARLGSDLQATLFGNRINLRLESFAPISVTAFSAEGQVLAQFARNLSAGNYALDFEFTQSGIRFYKLASPAGKTTLIGHSLGRGLINSVSIQEQSSEAAPLARLGRAPDVLTVTAQGFNDVTLNLPTTDTSGLVIVMQAEIDLEPFSFFATSLAILQELSGSQDGFGGDLSFGETGPGAGLRGADKLCTQIAEGVMPGSGAKVWRAFLSAEDSAGNVVNAIDRIGQGPWYDRLGRTVSENLEDLQNQRPASADPAIQDDLPNEHGIPNSDPDLTGELDNHHFLTGSNGDGELYTNHNYPSATCHNWTSADPVIGTRPRIGFSFVISSRIHWISGQDEGGCGPGIDIDGGGGSQENNPIVGSGGGYGGWYCFALSP